MLWRSCSSATYIDPVSKRTASMPDIRIGAVFCGDAMTFDELKEKALSLPFAPGVYLMRNQDDKVIYVGKAKKLKNRVSQYFQDTASHSF